MTTIHNQPPRWAIVHAEEEFDADGIEPTWPDIRDRANALVKELEQEFTE